MPSDPVDTQLRDSLYDALRGINKGDGYHTDAGKNVHKLRTPLTEVTVFPYLMVYMGPEKRIDPCAGNTRRSAYTFYIEGYVKSAAPDEDLAKLKADAKKAVLVDMGRGGIAVQTVFGESTPDYYDLSGSGRAAFLSEWTVDANWSPSAP